MARGGLLPAVQGKPTGGAELEWGGDYDDDCSAVTDGLYTHAEHLEGSRRGGIWYCSVSEQCGRKRLFHTADQPDIQPRNGAAARWLCELVICSATKGLLEAYSALLRARWGLH